VININQNNGTVVSDLTESEAPSIEQINEEGEIPIIVTTKRKGGRVKGSTNKSKQLNLKKVVDALTEASTNCLSCKSVACQNKKRLPPGSFLKIMEEKELKYGLAEGTINFQTLKSRVQANNPTGYCPQKVSPLADVEYLIVECCLRLSAIGEALVKSEVMGFADDILQGSIHVDKLIEFCGRRNIVKNVSDGNIVGTRWYTNFMKRHKDEIKCKPCRVQVI
jgi:hypothetical protein